MPSHVLGTNFSLCEYVDDFDFHTVRTFFVQLGKKPRVATFLNEQCRRLTSATPKVTAFYYLLAAWSNQLSPDARAKIKEKWDTLYKTEQVVQAMKIQLKKYWESEELIDLFINELQFDFDDDLLTAADTFDELKEEGGFPAQVLRLLSKTQGNILAMLRCVKMLPNEFKRFMESCYDEYIEKKVKLECADFDHIYDMLSSRPGEIDLWKTKMLDNSASLSMT